MSNQRTVNDEAEMTFGEHLDEIRKILIRVALTFALLFIVLFALKGIVLDIVFAPIRDTFPTNRLFSLMADLLGSDTLRIHPDNVELFNNKMAGQFMLHIKSSFVGAFIIAFPYLIWELWLFVKPALPAHQRKQSIRYAVETPIWFVMGLLFGYYVIAPLAVNFLGNYQVSDQISNIISVDSYLSTVLSVSFAAAVAFQLPLLIRLLATIGLITSHGMRQYRKIAVAALLIFAAIITPPDVVSQVLIFFPCYALYEYGIRIAGRIEARRAKEEAAYQAKLAEEKAKAEEEARLKAEQEAAEQNDETNDEQDNTPNDTPSQEQPAEEVADQQEDVAYEDNPHSIETILGGGVVADASYNSDFNGRREVTFGVSNDPEYRPDEEDNDTYKA
ncbi:MAG: twin-arginine translocase subunit TatC [Alistipes sp.]|nr:twin-arginine translocase subunit TatC [Alistipes sp.]